MTEREKYENCRKERALITDFLAFVFAKYRCYLGNSSGVINIPKTLNAYFRIDFEKLKQEEMEDARKEAEKVDGHTNDN
jgi:hypothetical protein